MTETFTEDDSGWIADDIRNALYDVLDESFAGQAEIYHRVINKFGVMLRPRTLNNALAALDGEGLAERRRGNGQRRHQCRRVTL